jgi:hypothetical protein
MAALPIYRARISESGDHCFLFAKPFDSKTKAKLNRLWNTRQANAAGSGGASATITINGNWLILHCGNESSYHRKELLKDLEEAIRLA